MDSRLDTNSLSVTSSSKRSNYLEWQEYFMAIAFLSAQRSKDPRTQVGACIVNKDKKIVGIGYNGMPRGCHDDKMPWNRAEDDTKDKWLTSKNPYVCHAELNAVLNKNQACVSGCAIYVALFPCNMCAQIIIQSGIDEVIYYSDKYHDKAEFVASRFLLDTAGVKYRQFRPRQRQVVVDFELIEATAGQVPTLPTLPISPSTPTNKPTDSLAQNGGQSLSSAMKSQNVLEKSLSDITDIPAVNIGAAFGLCDAKKENEVSYSSEMSQLSSEVNSNGVHNYKENSPKCINRNNCFIQNDLPFEVNKDIVGELQSDTSSNDSEPEPIVSIHKRRSSGLTKSMEIQFAVMTLFFIGNLIMFTLYCSDYYEPVCMATHDSKI